MTQATKGPRIHRIPPGDDRERLVCPECDYVAYQNPKVVVGSVATWEEKLLMCRRAIEPSKGLWTLPAGFLEMAETPEQGAAREAMEEACAEIEIVDMLALYSLTHISQLQVFFRARLRSPAIAAGRESLEAALFSFDALPEDELAFPSVRWAIDHYIQVRDRTSFVPFRNPSGEHGRAPRNVI
jgi:ADP-ribose pyrophosphatase YjhB (NUDIX family)